MSLIEEVCDDNRWAVYLKSDAENEENGGQKKDKQMENNDEKVADDEHEKEDLVEWIMSDIEEADGSEMPVISKTTIMGSVPEKSKDRYETTYSNFKAWMDTRRIKVVSQETLLKYLKELSKEKKPTTLWVIYSMLKSTIYIHDKIDISMYKQLTVFLKKLNVGYKVKEVKVFTPDEIERFLKEAPDDTYLAIKVVLILGITGELRRIEYCNITLDDIEDTGSMAKIKIINRNNGDPRLVTIAGRFYDIFKKYAELRPKKLYSNRFFLKYLNGRCKRQVIGVHKFGYMIKDIAKFLKLPDSDCYTTYSFRRSSVGPLLTDWGAGVDEDTHDCGCKFSKVAKRRTQDAAEIKRKLPAKKNEPEFTNLPADGEQSGTTTPPVKRRKNDNIAGVDPLNISNDKCTMRAAKAGSVRKMQHLVVQSTPQRSTSETAPKLTTKPAVSSELRKILQAPSSPAPPPESAPSQQKSQPKTVIIKAMPLNTKENVRTFEVLSTHQGLQVPPVVASQRPSEVCVKWTNHHNNLQTTFPSLLDTEEFVDVTLACEGKSLKCHKVILSSCSNYLATLLRENPCQHPIIIVNDLKFWQVEALVTFIYKGEVNVPQDRLSQLLHAAEALQVKGLAGSLQPEPEKPPTPIPQEKPHTSPSLISVLKTIQPSDSKASTSFPAVATSTSNLTSKQLLGSKGAKPVTRLQHWKTPQMRRFIFKARPTQLSSTLLRPTQSVVKPKSSDIRQTPIANEILENTDSNSSPICENLAALQESDDPGDHPERLDSADDDILLEFEAIQDIRDTKALRKFLPAAFLEEEQNIGEYAKVKNTPINIKNVDSKIEKSDSSCKGDEETKCAKKDKT